MEQINITRLIAEGKLRRFHIAMAVVCFFLFVFDGYDIGIYGTIVPSLLKDWHLSPVKAGAIGSYSLAGMAIGAVIFGIVADRIGRRKVILLSVFLFGVFTALCGSAAGPGTFAIFRFIAGLGLGAFMPNTIALLTDYCPRTRCVTVVSFVLCGYSIGAMLGSWIGIHLIPQSGWRSVLWLSAVSLCALPFIFAFLPESPHVLLRAGNNKRIAALLRRIDGAWAFDANSTFHQEADSTEKLPLSAIFRGALAASTVKFCAAFFSLLVLSYGLITWLPTLMIQHGYGLKRSLSFMIAWQIGGTVISPLAGRLADRFGSKRVLLPLYVAASAAMVLLSLSTSVYAIYVLAGLAGAAVFGAQNLVQIYMSQYYPPAMRSSALGAASCAGRIGGVTGPLLGGVLLNFALPVQGIIIAFAIPGLFAALAIGLVRSRPGDEAPGNLVSPV